MDGAPGRGARLLLTKDEVVELRSLQSPPEAVRRVLGATCLLLGFPPRLALDWRQLQGFVKTEALRLLLFPPDMLSPDCLACARAQLRGLSPSSVRRASAAAAGLFTWCEARLQAVKEGKDLTPCPADGRVRGGGAGRRPAVNASDIVQLKALLYPPLDVQRVVGATCLLLGFPECTANDWRLQNRGFLCDLKALDQMESAPGRLRAECLMLAKANLSGMSRNTIRAKSAAAEGLYVWCQRRLEVVELL